MKCDRCGGKYRAHKGYTLKNMNSRNIIIHACSLSCMKRGITDLITEKEQQGLNSLSVE